MCLDNFDRAAALCRDGEDCDIGIGSGSHVLVVEMKWAVVAKRSHLCLQYEVFWSCFLGCGSNLLVS